MNKLMALVAAAAISAGFGWNASAQPKGAAPAIAIIDTKVILEKAVAAKAVREQLEKIRAGLLQSTKARQDEVTKLSQDLVQERATLSQEAFQQRTRDVLQKRSNYQRELQEQQAKLDAASRAAAHKIEVVVGQIVDELKKEHQYAVVMIRSATMGTPSVPDITETVLGRLDRRLTHVDVVVN